MYSQRESFLAKREAEGELTFRYVENDGAPDNSMWCARRTLSHCLQCSSSSRCGSSLVLCCKPAHCIHVEGGGEHCLIWLYASGMRLKSLAKMCAAHQRVLTSPCEDMWDGTRAIVRAVW